MVDKYQFLRYFNSDYIVVNYGVLFVYLVIVFSIITYVTTKYNFLSKPFLFTILIYRTLLSCFLYYMLTSGDAPAYFRWTINNLFGNNLYEIYSYSTKFIVFILYPLVKYYHFTLFSCYMVFNVLGFIGLVFFYIAVGEHVKDFKNGMNILHFIILLPNLHVWTSIIGKDAVILLAFGMVLYSLNYIKNRLLFLILGLILAVHIRPHIFMIIVFALLLSVFLLAKNIKFGHRIIYGIIIIMVMIPGTYVFLSHTGLESVDVESAEEFLEERGQNWGGGSGIDVSKYNILFRIFTYLYRPLFFDAHNLLMILSSCENFLFLLITLKMISVNFMKFIINEKSLFLRFNLIYSLGALIALSSATGNLGTVARQKIMVVISIFAIITIYLAKRGGVIKDSDRDSKISPNNHPKTAR